MDLIENWRKAFRIIKNIFYLIKLDVAGVKLVIDSGKCATEFVADISGRFGR